MSVIAATTTPLLAAITLTLAIDFRVTFTAAALLTGYHLAGVAVAGFLFVASARVWGKRHLFLLGTVLMIVSSAWGGASSKNYASLAWARVVQGVALAPFEALVNACVGDLYFVHERGVRMAITNVALFGGAFMTPVVVGRITNDMGWEWTFYFVAIFMGAMLPLVFFFVPETAFRRADYLNTDMDDATTAQPSSDRNPSPTSQTPWQTDQQSFDGKGSEKKILNGNSHQSASTSSTSHPPPRRVPYWKQLLPFNGRKTDESFFKLLFRPLPLFLHLGILWACLIQGVIIGWTVLIGVVIAAIFLGPPLFFDELETGYLYTGAFIGSMIGLLTSALLSDRLNRLMIRLNRGIFEPEFRIILVLPMLIFCSIGLYGFGITAQDNLRYGWLIPDVFFSFVVVGMVVATVASALYIVDAHRRLAVEAFTCLLIFKNLFSFVLTYYAYDWVVTGGGESNESPDRIRHVFIIIGSIQVAICLLSVPMYVLGKRNRSFYHRHDILRFLRLN